MVKIDYLTLKKNIKEGKNIENTLSSLVEYQQNNYYNFWFVNLVMDYITYKEMMNENNYNTLIKQDEEMMDIILYFDKFINDSKYCLEIDLEVNYKTLINYKEILKNRINILTAYTDVVKQYEYIINRIEGKFGSEYIDIEDDTGFSGRVLSFIFEVEENGLINGKIKDVVSQLPIKMTKNKYNEYVEKALNKYLGANQEELEKFVTMIKETVNPKGIDYYDKYFPILKENMETIEAVDYTNLTEEVYKVTVKKIKNIATKINELITFHTLSVEILNELLGLCLCDKINTRNIKSDFYKKGEELFNLINKQRDNKFTITDEMMGLLQSSEGVIENCYEDIGRLESLIESATTLHIKEIDKKFLTKSFLNIKKIQMLMSVSKFAPFDSGYNDSRVNTEILAKTKTEVIQYINDSLKDKDRILQRAIKSNLFLIFPVVFSSPKEIYDYILNSLLACRDIHEKNATKEIIGKLMEDY